MFIQFFIVISDLRLPDVKCIKLIAQKLLLKSQNNINNNNLSIPLINLKKLLNLRIQSILLLNLRSKVDLRIGCFFKILSIHNTVLTINSFLTYHHFLLEVLITNLEDLPKRNLLKICWTSTALKSILKDHLWPVKEIAPNMNHQVLEEVFRKVISITSPIYKKKIKGKCFTFLKNSYSLKIKLNKASCLNELTC